MTTDSNGNSASGGEAMAADMTAIQKTIDDSLNAAIKEQRAGNLDGADRIYRKILGIDANHAEANHLLGVIALTRGSLNRAAKRIRKAISIDDAKAPFHNNLGYVLIAQKNFAAAEVEINRALEIEPDNAEYHITLANCLTGQGKTDDAITAFRKALDTDPGHESAILTLGNVLIQSGRFEEAVEIFRQGMEHHPENEHFANNLAGCMWNLGREEEAVKVYRKAVEMAPGNVGTLINLASTLRSLENFDEAEVICRRALKLTPDNPLSHDCLARILADDGRLDEGLKAYGRALELAPDNPDIHTRRALTRLLAGDVEGGFEEYEWRTKVANFPSSARNIPRPLWDGSPLEGRTILLHAEQGAGDCFQFVRYVPLVAEKGGKVILGCQKWVERVLRSVPGADEVAAEGAALNIDCHAPLMSLPHIMGTTAKTIPANAPYIHAEEELTTQWATRLAEFGGLKVGIVWQGSPTNLTNRIRSIPTSTIETLTHIPGVSFFSLQKLPAGHEVPVPEGFTDLAADLEDFADTAAVIANMDLVISIDTSVAHLSGAMARPTWVMVSKVPAWRWFMEGDSNPWYPEARIFRQPKAGDWAGVVEQVAQALKSRL